MGSYSNTQSEHIGETFEMGGVLDTLDLWGPADGWSPETRAIVAAMWMLGHRIEHLTDTLDEALRRNDPPKRPQRLPLR